MRVQEKQQCKDLIDATPKCFGGEKVFFSWSLLLPFWHLRATAAVQAKFVQCYVNHVVSMHRSQLLRLTISRIVQLTGAPKLYTPTSSTSRWPVTEGRRNGHSKSFIWHFPWLSPFFTPTNSFAQLLSFFQVSDLPNRLGEDVSHVILFFSVYYETIRES